MSWDKSKDELREEFSRQVNKRKPTKQWCKGKVGREHDPELVENHNIVRLKCGWSHHRFWANRQWNLSDWRYFCRHSYRCRHCGKYTEYVLKDVTGCPDYTPQPES